MAPKFMPQRRWFCGITTAMLTLLFHTVFAQAAAAQTRPVSPVAKSARAVASLVQSLVLAIFLLLLFIFMVSLLVAVRRIMLARRSRGREKTAHVDAWKIAGQRMKTDAQDTTREDSDDQAP
jgi:uncharacterized membrane protein YhaH (DUF805 family)